MTRNSSRIDPDARRLLSSIAGTRHGRVSAMALAHRRGAGRQLIDAGVLVRRGSTMASVAEDNLDDNPVAVMTHPITGHHGYLGHTAWQDEEDGALRRVYVLDMVTAASRAVGSCRECCGNSLAACSGHVKVRVLRRRGQGASARGAERGSPSRRPCASGSGRRPAAPRAASARFRRRAARSGS